MSYAKTAIGGFGSHADANAWWTERADWFAAVGMEQPTGWSGMTLAEKTEAAIAHVHERDRIARVPPG